MRWLTEDAVLVCAHELGIVSIQATQELVRIDGRQVLVKRNPEQRPIAGCPNVGPGIKACLTTLVVQKGYSSWLNIEGHAVCLDSVSGLTDGTPPGTVEYKVRTPGQEWVEEK